MMTLYSKTKDLFQGRAVLRWQLWGWRKNCSKNCLLDEPATETARKMGESSMVLISIQVHIKTHYDYP